MTDPGYKILSNPSNQPYFMDKFKKMLRKNLVVRKNFVPLHPQLSNKGVADTGCSAVGSVPGLGPGCRRFESCHPDEERIIQVILSFFILRV